MEYTVKRTEIIDPDIDSTEWQRAEVGYIAVNRWSEYCVAPATEFRVLCGREGISVLMHSEEKHLRMECKEENGEIYKDSCMEFFLSPCISDDRYLNFEFNPLGVLHLALGEGREDRALLGEERGIFSIVSMAEDGDWKLKFYIPYDFLKKYFGEISPVWKGNFYKCGDMTDHVHYGAWSEVKTFTPDFHRSAYFGNIKNGD